MKRFASIKGGAAVVRERLNMLTCVRSPHTAVKQNHLRQYDLEGWDRWPRKHNPETPLAEGGQLLGVLD